MFFFLKPQVFPAVTLLLGSIVTAWIQSSTLNRQIKEQSLARIREKQIELELKREEAKQQRYSILQKQRLDAYVDFTVELNRLGSMLMFDQLPSQEEYVQILDNLARPALMLGAVFPNDISIQLSQMTEHYLSSITGVCLYRNNGEDDKAIELLKTLQKKYEELWPQIRAIIQDYGTK